MTREEKLDKKQQAKLARLRRTVIASHRRRRSATKAEYELRHRLFREVGKHGITPEDKKPLPAAFNRAMKKYNDARMKLLSEKSGPMDSTPTEELAVPFEYTPSLSHAHVDSTRAPFIESFFLAPSQAIWTGIDGWGHYSGGHGSGKRASARAGTLQTTGDHVYALNHCTCGYWSPLYLTQRGMEVDLTLTTHVFLYFVDLEAHSFGKAALGHVFLESESGVVVSGAEQIVWPDLPGEEDRAAVFHKELLCGGTTPPGNWADGDAGMFLYTGDAVADNSFRCLVTIPQDRDVIVQVWEFIMVTANRYHPWRTDRCIAHARVSARFSPVKVTIEKKY
jgi:hypothetical protein